MTCVQGLECECGGEVSLDRANEFVCVVKELQSFVGYEEIVIGFGSRGELRVH